MKCFICSIELTPESKGLCKECSGAMLLSAAILRTPLVRSFIKIVREEFAKVEAERKLNLETKRTYSCYNGEHDVCFGTGSEHGVDFPCACDCHKPSDGWYCHKFETPCYYRDAKACANHKKVKSCDCICHQRGKA